MLPQSTDVYIRAQRVLKLWSVQTIGPIMYQTDRCQADHFLSGRDKNKMCFRFLLDSSENI